MGTMAVTEKRLTAKPPRATEFQLHKSQLPLPNGFPRQKLLDFTEFKLMQMIKRSGEGDKKLLLIKLLAEYRAGRVAIAWEAGDKPVYVQVSKV